MSSAQTSERLTVYQIKVQAKLDQDWSHWFDEMEISTENENDGLPITTLTGAVADQSALLGILLKIGYLNLTLISVNRIKRDQQ